MVGIRLAKVSWAGLFSLIHAPTVETNERREWARENRRVLGKGLLFVRMLHVQQSGNVLLFRERLWGKSVKVYATTPIWIFQGKLRTRHCKDEAWRVRWSYMYLFFLTYFDPLITGYPDYLSTLLRALLSLFPIIFLETALYIICEQETFCYSSARFIYGLHGKVCKMTALFGCFVNVDQRGWKT